MSEPRYTCCDLPVAFCGKSAEQRHRAEAAAEAARLLARTGWFRATYPGVCATCSEHFDVGQPIHRTDVGWSCCDG